MASRQSRNNVLAGSLVIAALVAAVVLVAQLGGLREQFGRVRYDVVFPASLGVAGLGPGSSVSVGGKEAGVVKAVEFEFDENGDLVGHVATVAIDQNITLRRAEPGAAPARPPAGSPADVSRAPEPDAPVVMRVAGLLTTQSNINILHTGPRGGVPIAQGERIEASPSPETIASANVGPLRERLEDTLDSARNAIEEVRGTIGTYRLDEQNPLFGDIKRSIENVREATDRLKGWTDTVEFDEDYAQIREVIDRISRSVRNLEDLVGQGQPIADKVNNRLDDIEEILRIVEQDYLVALRPTVQESLDRLRSSSQSLDELLVQVRADYDRFVVAALEDAQQTIAQLETSVLRADPEVRQMLASMRLGADQLRDTMIEVRRSPWRLLYRPSDQETEYELLYDAARLYAQAVSDLRGSVASLESVHAGSADASATEPIVETVQQAFERYQRAEAIFLERLTGEAPE